MNHSPNLQLLDTIIEQVEQHPETWHQSTYRCETGMCVAGWAIELSDDFEWANPNDPEDDYVVARGSTFCLEPYDAGRRILNLTDAQATELFEYSNTLYDIKRIRRALEP